jgi:hypothetical protein
LSSRLTAWTWFWYCQFEVRELKESHAQLHFSAVCVPPGG